MTIKWFLDIDGVLNCFPAPGFNELVANQDWRDGKATTGGRDYMLWWKASVVERINLLSKNENLEIVWLTTWTEDAQTEIEPLMGLSHFEAIGDTSGDWSPSSSDWWKWKRVQETVGEGEFFIWTDDDLYGVAEEAKTKYPRALLIEPLTEMGLQDSDLDRIEEYLAKV